MPKFSIVIPVYSELQPLQAGSSEVRHFRAKTVQRAIKSILNQQYRDWELILVDDGCADEVTPDIMQKFADLDKRIKVIHQDNQNRAIARNTGMDNATGEWICWLDCDDEYTSHYLRALDKAIKENPEHKIFNFGSLVYHGDVRSTIRETFYPSIEEEGHVWFRSGQIGSGSFIFRRDLWKSKPEYRIPDEVNPYQFAAASRFPMKLEPGTYEYENAENPEEAFQDGVYRHGLSLGNPWGDDALQFYLLTRDNHSKPLDILLYIEYKRGQEEDGYDEYGETYATE